KGQSLSGYRSPLKFFDVLFGGGGRTYEETLRDLEKKKSVLDSFLFSIKSMAKRATKQDKERLGQYYQTIRELEIRIAKEKLWAKEPKPKVKYGRPKDKMNGEEEIKAIYDLIILALQTDSSRVVTYRQPLQRLLTSMGINAIPHDLSHPNGGSPRVQFSRDKDVKQSELLAYFIDKLKDTKDSNGKRLFDSTLVSYGSNLRAGHMLKNVPAIITGNIDNKFKHGRHIEMPVNTPLCNLWLTMLQTAGVPAKSFGDSDGLIEPIFS
ncbi:MAG: DUF1552 domain-containing protein, partial [Lentisphaeraceae bacterium]|nr:DUF1552 domain-containing protein [Lentisphaeraceae bacterium]